MKNSLLISLILALVTPLACIHYDRSNGGHLIYDNRSDYSVQIRFYNIPDTFDIFSDSVTINLRSGSTWARGYTRGQHIGHMLSLRGYPDSAVIVYNTQRIIIDYDTTIIGQTVLTPKDGAAYYSKLIISYNFPSYQKETVWGGWFRNRVAETNYRYIFTNADYEFAKPIGDP